MAVVNILSIPRCLSVALCASFFLINLSSANAKEPTKGNRIPLEDVQRFSTAINQIKNYYVKPVKDKSLFDDAIKGMLSGLDPHSSYLDEKAFKALKSSTRGQFGGLGIEVTMENGIIKVVTPLDDTPAKRAGIKAGDYIIRLNKTPVKGMTLTDAVSKMRGKKGSNIRLTILRKGQSKPMNITLTRDVISIKSVKSKLYDHNFGYIRLTHFQSLTAKSMHQELDKLKKQAGGKLNGLVLDLRNNPGGLLDSAIQISDAFIHNDGKGKDELIVYTKGRLRGSKFTAVATPGDILNKAPIVVLINGGSASGSEIVAGALKDNKRALLVGTKSFGKGSVQTILPLDGKRGIKLTTALYYTPSGESIQAKGITPDIVVNEVTIPKKKEKKDTSLMVSEADLDGHLSTGKADDKKEVKATSISQLIHQDYQLHQAFNVLKGMSLVQQ